MSKANSSRVSKFLREPSRLIRSAQFHSGRLLYPRYKRPIVTLFRYTRALGDNLMLTTVAREVRKRNPTALIHVITGLPEIFARNPDVNFVSPEPSVGVPNLGRYLMRYDHRFPWNRHLLYYYAECVDIRDQIELKTYIYPSNADQAKAYEILERIGGSPILISREAGPRTDKKNYPSAYWKQVVLMLLGHSTVVDVGGPSTEPLDIYHPRFFSMLGKTTIHEAAALMKRSRLLISAVTGTLHLAAAVGLPVLSIVGGSEPAVATEYPNCRSLAHLPQCMNCYEKGPCIGDFVCLWNIAPESVSAAAVEMLREGGRQQFPVRESERSYPVAVNL